MLFDEKRLAFDIASMVHQARVERGLSQTELAKLTNKKQASVSRFESGRSLPSLKYLLDIAVAMNSFLMPPTIAFLGDVISYRKYYLNNRIVNVISGSFSGISTAIPNSEFCEQLNITVVK